MNHILYRHEKHPHKPISANMLHKQEHAEAGVNQRIAVTITKATGTMWAAYTFALLALLGFPALATALGPLVAIYVIWISQTFIQLCMLPILSVGQAVLGRKAELQSDAQFQDVVAILHNIEQIMNHLDAQDKLLVQLQERIASRPQD